MKGWIAGVKRWWLRRWHGVVEPPPQHGGRGTTWQQHLADCHSFMCKCGYIHPFNEADYVIREQEHIEDCTLLIDGRTGAPADVDRTPAIELRPCTCPVTDARYVKICPSCGLGHWKQA